MSDLVVNGQLDYRLIRGLFEADSAKAILRLPIPNSSRDDLWIWTKDKHGVFSVKHF